MELALTFDAKPVNEEVLSYERFLNLRPDEKAEVSEAHIVPPRLGAKGFGGVRVVYKHTIYKVK